MLGIRKQRRKRMHTGRYDPWCVSAANLIRGALFHSPGEKVGWLSNARIHRHYRQCVRIQNIVGEYLGGGGEKRHRESAVNWKKKGDSNTGGKGYFFFFNHKGARAGNEYHRLWIHLIPFVVLPKELSEGVARVHDAGDDEYVGVEEVIVLDTNDPLPGPVPTKPPCCCCCWMVDWPSGGWPLFPPPPLPPPCSPGDPHVDSDWLAGLDTWPVSPSLLQETKEKMNFR